MNPLTQIKNIAKLNEKELQLGVSQKSSWHQQYKDSAYVYIGGLPFDLSEGDIICVFSQYGEVIDINLVRDQKTGKSRGYCFLCYEDQRSTILAVDNFNGIKILGRTIKVDHVNNYRRPKEYEDDDGILQALRAHGVAPTAPIIEDTRHEPVEQTDASSVSEKERKRHKRKDDPEKASKKETRKHNKSSFDSAQSYNKSLNKGENIVKQEVEERYHTYSQVSNVKRREHSTSRKEQGRSFEMYNKSSEKFNNSCDSVFKEHAESRNTKRSHKHSSRKRSKSPSTSKHRDRTRLN